MSKMLELKFITKIWWHNITHDHKIIRRTNKPKGVKNVKY